MTKFISVCLIALTVFALPVEAYAARNLGYIDPSVPMPKKIVCDYVPFYRCVWMLNRPLFCWWDKAWVCEEEW